MNTENLIINPLKSADANQLHQFVVDNNDRLKKYFPVTLSSNSNLEKTTEYITIKNKEIEEKSCYTFAIRDKNLKIIVGLIIIKKIDWNKNQGEFAYCIDAQFEGKGLITFAVKEMTKFAFEELGLKTLQIISHKTNFSSVNVAENSGFVWRKTLLNEFKPSDGIPLNMELYELINER